uniref:Methyltransferase like 27 n=1 Tax=Neogobius melanostomus TaxID=47308 RepID=A0A8C6U359_9GOBI
MRLMEYSAPRHAADVLMKHFSGCPAEGSVLDVACGSGLVAQLLSSLGFRRFVGVDSSVAMLEQARITGLYQDLRPALLGTEALPTDPGAFDVVLVLGGLSPGFIPVSAVREFCNAAKPGGLVCLSRGSYPDPALTSYTEDLHAELGRLEAEGLWSRLEVRPVERYLLDPHGNCSGSEQCYISGTVYLFKTKPKTKDVNEA